MNWEFMDASMGHGAMATFMHAMLGGMAILIPPAFAVCVMITRMAWRRRNTFAQHDE